MGTGFAFDVGEDNFEEMFGIEDANQGRQEAFENANVEYFHGQSVYAVEVVALVDSVGHDGWDGPIYCHYEQSFEEDAALAIGLGEVLLVGAELPESD
jgi:hypothetical protein